MKELAGICDLCGKELLCLNGFFNGVIDNRKVYCFECEKKREEIESK